MSLCAHQIADPGKQMEPVLSQHTPTPWDCVVDGTTASIGAQDGGHRIRVASISGSMSNPDIANDAAFIVKAVNNHDALVAALTKARARIEYLGAACPNEKHFLSNERDFLPEIDAALEATA